MEEEGEPKKSRCRLRFGTLTNFTEEIARSARPSRGNLVKDFFEGSWADEKEGGIGLESYLRVVEEKKMEFAGFNLLLGELGVDGQFRMGYVSNREEEKVGRVLDLGSRTVGLSNATLEGGEAVWPKVQTGCRGFSDAVLSKGGDQSEEELINGLWNVLR